VKFNRQARSLFSGGTRALFNGSVRVLSSPRARRLAGRNRHMLLLIGLCALAVGLTLPLAGSRTKTYRDLRAQTPQRTTPGSSSPATTVPQSTPSSSGGAASPSGSSTATATGASGSAGLPSTAAYGGSATPYAGSAATSSGGSAATSSGGSAATSSGGTSASSGGSQPQAPPPTATFNAADHASAQPARVHLTSGVSDNGEYMFEEHSFQRLHIKTARVIVTWNVAVMRNKSQLKSVRKWLSSARSDHVTPMVSFAGNGNYVPSVVVYTAAIKAFLHDFPQVKTYTPWNEPDWIYRSLANQPWLAAGYFNSLAYWCHRCTIVAGDVYRPSWQGLAAWVRTYARYLHARPKAWALHPYDDVRAHTSSQIRAFESVTSGPIWLTEISGVERRGHWGFPNQSPNGANNDERYLFALPKRFHRIERIYHYQWQAVPAAPWDSGLVGPQGKPRPAYWTFGNAVKGKLP
jgi:hypothetical protein